MESACQRCATALAENTDARACSHGCTFCARCATAMENRCPNCGGRLEPIRDLV